MAKLKIIEICKKRREPVRAVIDTIIYQCKNFLLTGPNYYGGNGRVDVLLDRRPPPKNWLSWDIFTHFPPGNRPKCFTFYTFSQQVIGHSINTLSRVPTCNLPVFLYFHPFTEINVSEYNYKNFVFKGSIFFEITI